MSHLSSVLRGKALTVPILSFDGDPARMESAIGVVMEHAAPESHTLITLSESGESSPRVLTISSGKQRTVSQWRVLIGPVLEESGAIGDWDKALVLLPDAEPPRHL